MACFPNKHKSNYNTRDLLILDPEPCRGGAGRRQDSWQSPLPFPLHQAGTSDKTRPQEWQGRGTHGLSGPGQEVHRLGFQSEDQEGRALGTPGGGLSRRRAAG